MACLICTAVLLGLFHLFLLCIWFILTTGSYKIKKSLAGKVYVVTGATAGIGKVSALKLAENGAKVYLLCRNADKARRAKHEIRQKAFNNDVHEIICDLADFASVRSAAKELLDTGVKIDALINNAGIMRLFGEKRLTVDGCEEAMQANHLGHFLLTTLLLDRLKESKSRIVNVSSIAGLTHWNNNATKDFDPEDPAFERAKYKAGKAYCWSKLANILFTKELAEQLRDSGATTNCCHPGAVASDLQIPNVGKYVDKWIRLMSNIGLTKTPEKGAMTSLYLATSPDVDNVTGEYFADCAPGKASVQALDRQLAKKLWEASERIVSEKS